MSKIDIKEYIGYYIGQKVLINNRKLENVIDKISYVNEHGECGGSEYEWNAKDCQIILRPLCSITEEEKKDIGVQTNAGDYELTVYACYDSMHYLLKKGFDIFGLIDAGLAIDSTSNNTDKI